MASEKRPPGDGPRRRRPPTVIDLQATEVQPPPGVTEPPAQETQPVQEVTPKEEAPPAYDTQPFQDAKPEPPPMPEAPAIPPAPEQTEPAVAAAASTPPPPPPHEPASRQAKADATPPGAQPIHWLPQSLSWHQAGAAAAGAAGGFLLFLLLWLFGGLGGGTREQTADLSPRLAAIEKQLHDLAARPLPAAGADPRSVEEIAGRLARLEAAQAAPRAPVTDPVVLGRLTATEQAVKSMADNVGALSRRAEGVDTGLRDTQGRIDKLTAAVDELRTAVKSAAAGSDRAARFAAATTALRAAVERGDAFAAELAVAKPLAPDAAILASLEPYAAGGVPRHAALAHELSTLVKPMLQAAEPPRDGGFLDRLQANAEKLVRVRPVGESAGDDRAAVLARIDARAAQGNVPAALAEIAKLPAETRAAFQPWVAKVEARDRAIEASRKLAADSVAALRTH
jgi:hypothetical protein